MSRGRYVGYQMFDCDLDAFREMVATVSKRYKGKFWGWEWLNEITPGGTPDYVADYVKLCRVGVESARQVDPDLHSVLAGGLWPRDFRLDVLNAGAGKYVDVLPIHYGNGAGVEEAREDLDSYGLAKVGVWDNESCAFVIQWDCPGLEIVSETERVQMGHDSVDGRAGRRLRKADLFRRRRRRDRERRLPAGRLHAAAGGRHAGRFRRQDVRRQAPRRVLPPARRADSICSSGTARRSWWRRATSRKARTCRWPWARRRFDSRTTREMKRSPRPRTASPICVWRPWVASSKGPIWTWSRAAWCRPFEVPAGGGKFDTPRLERAARQTRIHTYSSHEPVRSAARRHAPHRPARRLEQGQGG